MMPFCDLRPHLTRLFLLAQPQTEFYYFPLHSPSAAPFSPSKSTKENFIFNSAYPPLRAPFFTPRKAPKRNFIFNTAYPPSARHFHPRKAPKRILFLTLHSPSAATFFIPVQSRTEFYFLTLHPFPSTAARGSSAALQYFRSCRPPFTTRGTGSPYMPNTSNDRARNALHSAETEKFSRPQTLRPPHIGAQGRPYKMNTRKNCIHRRGGGYIILGLSAGAGAAGDIL